MFVGNIHQKACITNNFHNPQENAEIASTSGLFSKYSDQHKTNTNSCILFSWVVWKLGHRDGFTRESNCLEISPEVFAWTCLESPQSTVK